MKLVGLGGPSDSGLYSGPHYPRVLDAGAGRRDVEWNPWQTTYGVVVRPPDQGALGYWPALTPGAVIAEERAGFPVMYFSAQAPNAAGAVVRMDYQIPLNPRSRGAMPDGLILTDARLSGMPAALLPQRDELPDELRGTPQDGAPMAVAVWDPIAGTMVDLGYRELDDGRWVWADSITGPSGPYGRYDGERVARELMPFSGHACFHADGVQGPCSGDPDNATTAPGTDGYETGSPGNPYRPYLDPESEWYGHPVLMRPADPDLPETHDPWEEIPPVYTPGDPVDPEPAEPEPIPCYDDSTGITGVWDPIAGQCLPPIGEPDPPDVFPAPAPTVGASGGWLAMAAAVGLALLGGRR